MKRTLSIIAALGVSLFFIGLSLRGKNLGDVGEAVRHADYRWILVYAGTICAIHFIRVVRWGVLVEPVVKIRFRDLNMIGAVGFMLLMVLPLRLGEFGRPFLLAGHMKVSKSSALASIVFERIVDGLSMGALLVLLLWILGPRMDAQNAAILRAGAMVVTLGFGGGLALLIFAARLPRPTEALVRHTLGRVAPRLAERVVGMLRAFTEGLRVLLSFGKALEFFGLTALYWTTAALGLIILGRAFGFNDLPWIAGFTMVGLQVVGAMIPGGPGSAGTFQVFTQFGLALFVGHSMRIDAVAVAYANVIWLVQFAQQIVFGLYFIVLGRIHPKALLLGLWSGREGPDVPPDQNPPPPPGDARASSGAQRHAEAA